MHKITTGSQIHYVFKFLLIFLTLSAWSSAELYAQITIEVNSKVNPTCSNSADGSISVTVSGGNSPYTYDWDGPGTFDSDSEDISNLISGEYKLTVTDATSATEEIDVSLNFIDNEAPVISHNGDQNINSDAGVCGAAVSVSASATDNCDVGNPTGTRSDGQPLTATYPVGTTTITWNVTDENDNDATPVTQTVIVTDNEAPVISHNGDQNINSDAGVCGAAVSVSASATDNCDVGNPTGTRSDGQPLTATYPVGTTTITWNVTDENDNDATPVTQTVIVTDNEAPVISHNGDQNVNNDEGFCSATVMVSASATDNCSVANPTGARSDGLALNAPYPIGTTTITWNVADINGNPAEPVTQTVLVTDNIIPVISHNGNKTVNNEAGQCSASVNVSASVIENCNEVEATGIRDDGEALDAPYPVGTTIITWNVTDVNGNDADPVTQEIVVMDNEDPVIPELPEITSECAITLTPPTTTDNCDASITATTGTDLTIEESTSVFWIFTDSAGNSTEPIEQIVTIADTQAPVPDQTSLPIKSITGCQISSIAELDIPTATDACDGLITGSLSDDFQFPYSFYGTSTVTWEFMDESGNISTQEQVIQLNEVTIEGGTITGTFNSSEFQQQIDISSCGASINVDLELSGEIGNIIQWEKFAVNEGFWEVISNTTRNYPASFTTGALESTYFRVLIQAGTCTEYSETFFIRALPAGDAPTVTVLDDDNKYCLGEDANLLAESNYLATQPAIPSDMSPGDFNQGQLNTQDPDSWLVDGETGGFTAGGNSKKARNWSGTNDHEFGDITYDGGDGKFAIAQGNFFAPGNGNGNSYSGNIPTTLESPIMDLSNAFSASLEFDQAFYFANNDIAVIEISTDGGDTYSTLRMMHNAGTGVMKWLTAGTAESTAGSNAENYNFSTDNTSIPLDDYIGESEVRIRWSFTGTSDNSVWALDNIFIYNEVYVDTELEWTVGIGDPDENPIEQGQTSIPISFIPETPGIHEYGATALINGCRTYDEDGTDLIELNVSYSYAGEDIIYSAAECGRNTVQLNAYDNSKTANENATKGAYPTIPENCKTCDNPGTGDTGTWSWSGDTPACQDASFSDVNDPDATFTAGPGTYTLTWTVDGCSNNITVTITDCDQVDFDGTDDHVNFDDNYDLTGAFSLEVWIKPESLNGIRTIFSKRDANFSGTAKGYDLRIKDGIVSFNWDKTGSISSPHSIPNTNRWYHIALTHSSSGEYKLYIDGILMKLTAGGAPTANDYRALFGAMDTNEPNVASNFFHGWMEEMRIWSVALTSDQLHQMMNQRINESGTNKVRGEIIPIDVTNLNWSNLTGYYRFDDIGCGNLLPYSDGSDYIGHEGKLINITSAQQNTAPLPYISNANGVWRENNTWLHPDVWTWPNDDGINGDKIDWNIAQISHDINSTADDITLLGLLSETGELLIEGNVSSGTGHGLTITNYFELNGIVNLDGHSQLIQTEGSILEPTSSGFIEVDQQGTKNSFNYNYWSSPVSLINNSQNNTGFQLKEVLFDGTTANPTDISFNGQYHWADGNYSGNARISTYWLYTFQGVADDYSEWHRFGETTTLPAAVGYTMKGTRGWVPVSDRQNYTFKGKPNNGDISINIGSGQNLLLGNPYPSAIDANKFIEDNLNNFNGSIYYWDHFGPENSHYLEEYVGGYAVFNLSGGVEAATSSDARINDNNESGSKTPGNYIPVAQAFFVNSLEASNPSTITFKNEHRAFVKEAPGDSQFLSQEYPTKNKEQASYTRDSRFKIRLTFNSPKGYRRQILVTADAKTTNGYDIGYDAPLLDNFPEDMYWVIDESEFVIQAVPNFNFSQVLPLGMRFSEEGEFSIELHKLENFTRDVNIYLHDKEEDTYHNLTKAPFKAETQTGSFNDRYEIVFKAPEPEVIDKPEINPDNSWILVDYLRDSQEIMLGNPDLRPIEHAEVFSLNGQLIERFTNIQTERDIVLPIGRPLSSAIYIVRIYSKGEEYSRKIIISN